ncbi:hypothetical protein RKD26_004072 [Streptomyces calvus]
MPLFTLPIFQMNVKAVATAMSTHVRFAGN